MKGGIGKKGEDVPAGWRWSVLGTTGTFDRTFAAVDVELFAPVLVDLRTVGVLAILLPDVPSEGFEGLEEDDEE